MTPKQTATPLSSMRFFVVMARNSKKLPSRIVFHFRAKNFASFIFIFLSYFLRFHAPDFHPTSVRNASDILVTFLFSRIMCECYVALFTYTLYNILRNPHYISIYHITLTIFWN